MKKKMYVLSVLLVILLNLVFPSFIHAQSVHGTCGNDSINTAIGCVPVLQDYSGKAFASFLLKWGIGVGSGVSFLLMLYAGFMIMTSQGNPERLKAGQELLTSAVSGIILLIFSIFILNFIGVSVLGIFQ